MGKLIMEMCSVSILPSIPCCLKMAREHSRCPATDLESLYGSQLQDDECGISYKFLHQKT